MLSTPKVNSPSSGGLSPVIIAIATAFAALACSLFAGGLYYFTRRWSPQNSVGAGTGPNGNGILPAHYASLDAIQQRMASSRAPNPYDILPQGKGHYSTPSKESEPYSAAPYDEVSLAQLNEEVDRHQEALSAGKLEKHYNDLPKQPRPPKGPSIMK